MIRASGEMEFALQFENWGLWSFTICYVLASAFILVAYNQRHPVDPEFVSSNPAAFYLNFNIGFAISKFSDIVFQLVFAAIIYMYVYRVTQNINITVFIFFVLFVSGHSLLIYTHGPISFAHIIGAAVGGIVFPILMFRFAQFLPVLITVHWTFYIVARIFVPLVSNSR
tara:strand:+ start:705 stop:1211 length:507 start_codon:yes stop_codon:yes gene_type:complete